MRLLQEALTFDDVLLVPAHSTVLPKDVDLSTQLTREIDLSIPLISAAMDTVTEARFAIALALEGGIGIIHKNMTPVEQAQQVLNVKKYESGVIKDPITVRPDTTISEVLAITHRHNISGVPVVDGDELVLLDPRAQREAVGRVELDAPGTVGDDEVVQPRRVGAVATQEDVVAL